MGWRIARPPERRPIVERVLRFTGFSGRQWLSLLATTAGAVADFSNVFTVVVCVCSLTAIKPGELENLARRLGIGLGTDGEFFVRQEGKK